MKLHPNIKFKGDKQDKHCKNTITMIEYVTKDPLELKSNFDWKHEIEKKSKKDNEKMTVKEDEKEFCMWLRDIILNHPTWTKNELRKKLSKTKIMPLFS